MASVLRGLPGGGQQTKRVRVPQTLIPDYLKESSVTILLRSVIVLDEWLEKNEGHIDDEVRLRRVKHWREETLQQLRLEFNLSRV
jgi:hypothetical protein